LWVVVVVVLVVEGYDGLGVVGVRGPPVPSSLVPLKRFLWRLARQAVKEGRGGWVCGVGRGQGVDHR
jgi:hypothetical protein